MTAWIIDTFGSVEALAQVTLAAVVGGVIGVHIVLRRLPFLVMGLTHATFPGLVLAALTGVNLLGGTLAFGVVVVILISLLGATDQVESSSAIGVVLAAGFALGWYWSRSQTRRPASFRPFWLVRWPRFPLPMW